MDHSQEAFEYAKAAHASISQKRKYSGDEYIVHPMRVVAILRRHGISCPDILAAAYLHDVLEDVYPLNAVYSPQRIAELFGMPVLNIVNDLTDQFTKERYPAMNRAERKVLEAFRISEISGAALAVKMADFIDNTSDITVNDPGFAKVYLIEKNRSLRMLTPRVPSFSSSLLALYSEALSNCSITPTS